MKNDRVIAAKVSDALFRRLARMAERDDRTISYVVRRMIEKALA